MKKILTLMTLIMVSMTELAAVADAQTSAEPGNGNFTATSSDISLSVEEQNVIAEINFARTQPKRYVEEVLEPYLMLFNDDGMSYYSANGIRMITREGVKAVQEAIDELNAATPLQPLTGVQELNAAAFHHTGDIGPLGLVSHDSSDGTQMSDRVRKYMPNSFYIGECIDFGHNTGRDIVRSLIVDDGVSSRGHRHIVMNGRYTRIGVSIGIHAQYNHMCTVDFGNLKQTIPE